MCLFLTAGATASLVEEIEKYQLDVVVLHKTFDDIQR